MERLVSFGFLALPTVFITLSLLGALIALRWRRIGLAVVLVANLSLYASATPAMSSWILHRAEAGLPRTLDLREAQAIVVLGGDVRRGNGGGVPDRLGGLAYERLALAADAYRRLHLPVAVSGGSGPKKQISEAALMKDALEGLFAVPVAWDEDRSRTTWENAVFTARLLQSAGVTKVVVVTHPWHQPRALWAFRKAGLEAMPWPGPRTPIKAKRLRDYQPSLRALVDSFYGLHEIIGMIYYRLRY